MNEVESIITDCEKEVANSASIKTKLESINTIVQIKSTSDKVLYYNELYRDVKKLIIFYLKAIDERKYEYDYVNKNYLVNILNIFKDNEKIALLNFLLRKLKVEGLEDEKEFFGHEKRKVELALLRNQLPSSFFKLSSKLITYNLGSIFFTIVASYFIYSAILLPAPSYFPALFEVKYEHVSDDFVLNHFCNTLLSIVGSNSEDFIKPLNLFGSIVLVLGRLFFLLLILKICIDKFIDVFKSTF
jgi:hypothetical protein